MSKLRRRSDSECYLYDLFGRMDKEGLNHGHVILLIVRLFLWFLRTSGILGLLGAGLGIPVCLFIRLLLSWLGIVLFVAWHVDHDVGGLETERSTAPIDLFEAREGRLVRAVRIQVRESSYVRNEIQLSGSR